MKQEPYWENPWKESCIVLGSGIRIMTSKPHHTVRYDMYALETNNGHNTIHFGARFSGEPSDYESGEANYYDGKWHITCGKYTSKAAAEYFANHYRGK